MKKKKTFKLKETYSGWDIRRAADICKLSAMQRTVLERIADYAQSEHCLTSMDQNIYPRYSDLADRIGSLRGGENISHCTISRIVSRLSVLGYLIVVASPRGNRFFIPQSLFLRAYLQSNPADEMVRSHLAAELKRVREITRTNPKRFGGRKGQDLKKIRSRMTNLARAVKEGGGSEKSDLAELGNVVDIFCKTSSEKLSKISFIQKSDLAISDGRTLQLAMVGPCNNDRSIEPTLSRTTLSRTDIYIPTSKSIDSVESTAAAKVGMDVFVKHDVFGRYARVFRQQLASKAEIEKFYAEYLKLAEVSFSAILRNLEIFETVPAMQTSSCAGGYSKLNRLLSLKVEDAATGKRKDLGAKYGFWDKVPSRVVVAKIALNNGWSPELTHQWLLEKPADDSFLNLVKSVAAERAEANRVVEDERARKQAEHEAMEARLAGESEEYRQLAARLQEQNSYRVFPGCDWVKDFITKATFAQLSAAVEDGGRFEDKKEIPGDQAEQTGDASITGSAEPSAEAGEETQPAGGLIPANASQQPQPTERSDSTEVPPAPEEAAQSEVRASEVMVSEPVEPQATIAQEEKGIADAGAGDSGHSGSYVEDPEVRALLSKKNPTSADYRKAFALIEKRKRAGKGAPPPVKTSNLRGSETVGGATAQSATEPEKVQNISANELLSDDFCEFLEKPAQESACAGGKNIHTRAQITTSPGLMQSIDDYIFGAVDEMGPVTGLSGSGPEQAEEILASNVLADDPSTNTVVVDKQRPDTSAGSGLQVLESSESLPDNTTSECVLEDAPPPSGVFETSRGASLVCPDDLSASCSDLPAEIEQGPEKQRPEAQNVSGPGCAINSHGTYNSTGTALPAERANPAGQPNPEENLTPPTMDSTGDGLARSTLMPEDTPDSEMLPGETVEDYVKRACRTSFLNKPLQHLQASERIRNLSSDTEKIEQARLLLSAA